MAHKVLILFFISYCNTDCVSLPKKFESYDQAYTLISNAKFKFSDNIDTRNSSWIRSLKYFSCDNNFGFLWMKTGGKTYIHQDVPFDLWLKLKEAESYGTFWNKHLKNRYPLALSK